ncbi:MAG TPA: hypothetical protein VK939_08405 [Longimicrobiales bacterium]|nr:hypothetical protein [Longimicrobiales bacterium]
MPICLACRPAGVDDRAGDTAEGTDSGQPDPRSGACIVEASRLLPSSLSETSGLARGARDTTRFWTHNDGASARLYALDADGALLGESEIAGLELADWEDIASGRCAGEPCLLVGDIGDNDGVRDHVAIHEVREPVPGAGAALLRTLRLRYPDGPQDAEALFTLPDESRYIITKGRQRAITLYRVPATADAATIATLERVRELAPAPRRSTNRVTGAAARADGRLVVVRTNHTLLVFTTEGLLGGAAPVVTLDVRGLREPQGEGIAIGGAGTVWLTSEAARRGLEPRWTRLACPLPA